MVQACQGIHSPVTKINDIGEVMDEGNSIQGEKYNGEIAAIISCLSCKTKVTDTYSVVGECRKCGLKFKMSKSAKSTS